MLRSVLRHGRVLLGVMVVQQLLVNLGVPFPGWMQTADAWYASAVVAALDVWLAWNLWHVIDDLPRAVGERRARRMKERVLERELAEAYPQPLWSYMSQAYRAQVTFSAAGLHQGPPSHMRYMLPPSVTLTGPQPRVMEYAVEYEVVDGVRVATGALTAREVPPGDVSGLCGKCRQPLAEHTYYGTGPCIIACKAAGWVTFTQP